MEEYIQRLFAKAPAVTPSNLPLTAQKIEAINSAPGEMLGDDCPICKNKGYVAVETENGIACRECECMTNRRNSRRLAASGLEDMVSEYSLDKYLTPNQWQIRAKELALAYLDEPDGKWFMVSGTPGTGKTHLCSAICAELMRKSKDAKYMLWRDEAPRLKGLVNERAEYDALISVIKKADVLYIDDFFKGTVTAADVNLAFEIINARYNARRKKTIISSEKDINDIIQIDEALGSRIYERSKGYCIKTPSQNWRLK